MKKRKLIVAMGLAVCASGFAQDDVTINLASGKKVYKVDDIKSLTFEGNNLKVTKQTDETETFAFSELTSISFDATTGVSNLKVDASDLSISVQPGSNLIEIKGYDGKTKYSVAVYTVSGKKVLGFSDWKGEAVDIASLPAGVYVIKINDTTLKFRK